MIPKISLYNLLFKTHFQENAEEKDTVNFYLPLDLLETISGNISLHELFVLSLCIKNKNPKNTLELGTFNGRTTLSFLYNTRKENKIYTVDLPSEKALFTKLPIEKGQTKKDGVVYDELGFIGQKKIFDNYPYSFTNTRIKQIWKDTGELTSEDLDNNNFDFVFVDASHSYENAKHDLYFSLSIVNPNAVIFFHDYGKGNSGWIGVNNALNEFYIKEIFSEQPSMEMYHIEDTSIVVLLT